MTKARGKQKKAATDVLVGWAIDRSSSMAGLVDDTINGFNAWVESQKGQDGKMWLSLVLFDSTFDAPIVAADIESVEGLTRDIYRPNGWTALYDSVKVTIEGLEGWLRNHPEFTGKVLVNIWTDGGENSSKYWSRLNGGLGAMQAKISEKQAEGWTFAFMGSGGSAWTEGESFQSVVGVANTSQFTPTAGGTRMSYATSSMAVKGLRSTGHYAGTNSMLRGVTETAAVMDSFNLTEDDVTEALAGTTNKTE